MEPVRRDLEDHPSPVSRFDRLMGERPDLPKVRAPRGRQRLRILWRGIALWPHVKGPGRRALWELARGIGEVL